MLVDCCELWFLYKPIWTMLAVSETVADEIEVLVLFMALL